MPSPSSEARYVLDSGARLLAEGRLLLGGQPPRLFRLTDSGTDVVTAALTGSGETAGNGAGERLLEHLWETGVLHRRPEPVGELPELTFVVPVRQPVPHLEELLALLASARHGDVVVVDDGSEDGGAATTRAASRAGATVVRRGTRGGPAAARNAAEIGSDLVVYLDADTALDAAAPLGWLGPCLAHFGHPKVAVVAPRVRSLPGAGAVASYEEESSPLDLGPEPGWVGSFRRHSYVPATALVCRVAALGAVGGFDPSLRFGEDVDLVRRLEGAGWLVRYEPGAVVWHRPRSDLAALCRQRACYGTAAAQLDHRHPGTVAPYAGGLGSTSAALGLLGALAGVLARQERLRSGALVLWAISGLFPAFRLHGKLARARTPVPSRLALSLVTRAQLDALRALLRALRRCWWPLPAAMLAARRTRYTALLLLLAAQLGRLVEPSRQRAGDGHLAEILGRKLRHAPLFLADDISYGAGVWLGCIRSRSFRALLPVIVRPSRATAGRRDL